MMRRIIPLLLLPAALLPSVAQASSFDGLGILVAGMFGAAPFSLLLLILIVVTIALGRKKTPEGYPRLCRTNRILACLFPIAFLLIAWLLEGELQAKFAGIFFAFEVPLLILGAVLYVVSGKLRPPVLT